MATINCSEIQQVGNELLIAFQDCKKVNPTDLATLVELVLAVNICTNGGPSYDTLVEEIYEPLVDEIVSYPIGTYHSISIMILQGNIERNGVTYPTGSVLDHEVTNLNQTAFSFTVKSGAQVVVQYLIETV